MLYGVLQHTGAEPSAHETITAEQDTWGSIAQLAAEYETIAAAAQHDRWGTLIRRTGLTAEQADDVVASDAFGALSAELRRAEANRHDVDVLLPRLAQARGIEDAEDVAAVLHARLARTTTRPASSGRSREHPRLIAGLIPEAQCPMSPDMRTALDERRDLIQTRAEAVLDAAIAEDAAWVRTLGEPPSDPAQQHAWRHHARTAAAYRDRYGITGTTLLGETVGSTSQRIDAARAQAALARAREMVSTDDSLRSSRRPVPSCSPAGPAL